MSKYITHFQTEAEYQTALQTLDLPNVSLVDELGEVHYHRALYGAHAGDICLYDVAEGQKIVVTTADWNLTTYPTASYPIIGVVVADESPEGCYLISTKFINTDGTPTLTPNIFFKWMNTSERIWENKVTFYGTTNDAATAFDGKGQTDLIISTIKDFDLANGTDNITGNIGDVIKKFSVDGTAAGDWFIPSAGELYLVGDNVTTISNTFKKIHNTDNNLSYSSVFVNNLTIITSTFKDNLNIWKGSTKSDSTASSYDSSSNVRPFYRLA